MRLHIVALIAIALAGCSAAPTEIPTATATPAPVTSPTATAPAPTAEPTKDPNVPDWAIRKDAQGNYMKVENGKQVPYKNTQIINDKGTVVYSGWLGSHVENGSMNHGAGIPLMYHEDFVNGTGNDVMPLSFNSSIDVSGLIPFFKQNSYGFEPNKIKYSLTTAVYNYLYHNRRDQSLTRPDFWVDSNHTSKIQFNFTTPDGVQHDWDPYKAGYEFDWVSVQAIEQLGFYYRTPDELDKSLVYYWTPLVTPDHKLVVLGAVEHPETLDKRQKFEMVFHPMYEVIIHKNLPPVIDYWEVPTVPNNIVDPLLKPGAIISLD